MLSLILASFLFPLALSKPLVKRGEVLTGQYDTESEAGGRFMLEQNLWGMFFGTGSQTSQATAEDGDAVTWTTNYTWQNNPTAVKSYANLDLKEGMGKAIEDITSIPTSWQWTYIDPSDDLVADVSYDLWLSEVQGSTGASADSTYEIMLWLSTRGGAQPAGSQIGTADINGETWDLWQGLVGTWTVFSFVVPEETMDYEADLLPFLQHLTENQGVPASQFLVQAQSGTEPFVGTASLTSTYALAVN